MRLRRLHRLRVAVGREPGCASTLHPSTRRISSAPARAGRAARLQRVQRNAIAQQPQTVEGSEHVTCFRAWIYRSPFGYPPSPPPFPPSLPPLCTTLPPCCMFCPTQVPSIWKINKGWMSPVIKFRRNSINAVGRLRVIDLT